MKVFVVIAVHNRKVHTLNCLQLLHRQSFKPFGIVLVDDGSDDGTADEVKKAFPQVNIINGNGNWWWARSMNEGFRWAVQQGGEVIITLNNDTAFSSDLIGDLLALHSLYPRSVIGCLNTVQKEGEYIFFSGISHINWWKAKEYKYHRPFTLCDSRLSGLHDTLCLNGRGTLIPVNVFNTIGYFDDRHFPQYASDYDFTLRAVKAGVKVMMSWDIKIQSVIEVTGQGRSFIRQSWWQFLLSFGNRYSANSLRLWWHYYRIHAGYKMLTGFMLQILRLCYSFYSKRNLTEGLR